MTTEDPDGTGADPERQSTDGEGLSAEELERRAAAKKSAKERDAELLAGTPAVAPGYADTVGSDSGGSIRSRGEALDADEEEQAELFPIGTIAGDPKLRIQDIKKIIGNNPVNYEVKLAAIPVPVEGIGLLDPREHYRYAITILPGNPDVKLERSKEAKSTKINGVTVVQHARVIYIEPLEQRIAEERRAFSNGEDLDELAIRADERAKVLAEFGIDPAAVSV